MAQFSFDIESTYDLGEMNNVYDQVQRELGNRYDFKGTHTALEWVDDRKSLKIYGDTQYHLDAVMDMLLKKAASRGVSVKTFDTSQEPETTNLRMIWVVPLKNGLKQDDAKKITKLLKESLPKTRTQTQGEIVRVMSAKKDDLQSAMQLIQSKNLDFPTVFTNYR